MRNLETAMLDSTMALEPWEPCPGPLEPEGVGDYHPGDGESIPWPDEMADAVVIPPPVDDRDFSEDVLHEVPEDAPRWPDAAGCPVNEAVPHSLLENCPEAAS